MQQWFMRDLVGLDLDSVLARTELAIDRYIREQFGIALDWENEVHDYEIENFPHLTDEMKEQTLNDIFSGQIMGYITPHNYAEHAINKLRINNLGVYIVTSRPYNLKKMTMKWLEQHNINYDGLIMVDSMLKYEVVKGLHLKAFVEDQYSTLECIYRRCGELPFGLYVVDLPWNRKFNDECAVRVKDVADAVDKIVEKRREFYESEL